MNHIPVALYRGTNAMVVVLGEEDEEKLHYLSIIMISSEMYGSLDMRTG